MGKTTNNTAKQPWELTWEEIDNPIPWIDENGKTHYNPNVAGPWQFNRTIRGLPYFYQVVLTEPDDLDYQGTGEYGAVYYSKSQDIQYVRDKYTGNLLIVRSHSDLVYEHRQETKHG